MNFYHNLNKWGVKVREGRVNRFYKYKKNGIALYQKTIPPKKLFVIFLSSRVESLCMS
jgi:hypothetical protein